MIVHRGVRRSGKAERPGGVYANEADGTPD
jgi:hypothetical protein